MADSDGESVSRVSRLWWSREFEQPHHHLLHLLLFRVAVAHNRRFNGPGRVFCHLQPARRSGQHGYTAHLSELKSRFHVDRVKNVFDCGHPRLMLCNDPGELGKNLLQSCRHGVPGPDFDGATGAADEFTFVQLLHNAVAGVLTSAIDAEDTHWNEFTSAALRPCCHSCFTLALEFAIAGR